jgi:hypothetical protein
VFEVLLVISGTASGAKVASNSTPNCVVNATITPQAAMPLYNIRKCERSSIAVKESDCKKHVYCTIMMNDVA